MISMSTSEEDSYSMIFASLKHPIRRKILRILSSEPQAFSDLQKEFNIESSHLTYHIDGLGNLLRKTSDSRYALSSLGNAAVTMMRNVEEPSTSLRLPFTRRPLAKLRQTVALGIICIVLAASLIGTLAYYVPQINSKNNAIDFLNARISQLEANTTDSFLAPTTTIENITSDPGNWENQTVVVEGELSGLLLYFTYISWDRELSTNGTVYPQDSLGRDAIGVNLQRIQADPYDVGNVVVAGIVKKGYIGTIVSGESPTVSYYIEASFLILK